MGNIVVHVCISHIESLSFINIKAESTFGAECAFVMIVQGGKSSKFFFVFVLQYNFLFIV